MGLFVVTPFSALKKIDILTGKDRKRQEVRTDDIDDWDDDHELEYEQTGPTGDEEEDNVEAGDDDLHGLTNPAQLAAVFKREVGFFCISYVISSLHTFNSAQR